MAHVRCPSGRIESAGLFLRFKKQLEREGDYDEAAYFDFAPVCHYPLSAFALPFLVLSLCFHCLCTALLCALVVPSLPLHCLSMCSHCAHSVSLPFLVVSLDVRVPSLALRVLTLPFRVCLPLPTQRLCTALPCALIVLSLPLHCLSLCFRCAFTAFALPFPALSLCCLHCIFHFPCAISAAVQLPFLGRFGAVFGPSHRLSRQATYTVPSEYGLFYEEFKVTRRRKNKAHPRFPICASGFPGVRCVSRRTRSELWVFFRSGTRTRPGS